MRDHGVEPELLWRPQDVGDARTIGYELREIGDIEWRWPARKTMYAAGSRDGGGWLPLDCN